MMVVVPAGGALRRRAGQISPAEVMEQTWVFKDHWRFEITGGWQLPDDSK
jgi:hypothetical protein